MEYSKGVDNLNIKKNMIKARIPSKLSKGEYAEVFIPHHNISFIRKVNEKGIDYTYIALKANVGDRKEFYCENTIEDILQQYKDSYK
jgi:hypothetical protein